MTPETRKTLANGLWHNNPALVQILGLCPLLATSTDTVNAIGLGLATIFVLTLSNTLVAATRRWLRPEIRIPVFVLLIAGAVTVVEILIQALAYPLYQSLGIYLALIVTNCVIIARAEAYAAKNPVLPAAIDGAAMGTGFALVLILLGGLREILATGTLLVGADRIFGAGTDWTIRLYDSEHHLILAALPPGAFLCYGLLIAGKNVINEQYKRRRKKHTASGS
ncbi:electron transport complex subunit E [uncultured Cardiobacterium sp.]|uniref:electron transport complex subunit E n=1 Tax=uncultured Cardiobacterium sp. TaxID=417619 RepID=UPI002611997F|nr:electron transport complex subunit E [uncultured Cardiobacterium sp.]